MLRSRSCYRRRVDEQLAFVQLIAAVKDLDWGYLQTWAIELGVRDALERIGGS